MTRFNRVGCAIVAASALCATAGTLAQLSSAFAMIELGEVWFNWFSEQCYTAMLILPVLLSARCGSRPIR